MTSLLMSSPLIQLLRSSSQLLIVMTSSLLLIASSRIYADVITADSRFLFASIQQLISSTSEFDVPAGSSSSSSACSWFLSFQLIHYAPAGSTWPPPDYEQLT
ncbi:hypothetical protein F511_15452 [Dorcoceras hygrometricum]|uniref:Uncharacterized protein n=1 Tax=Dorcoceras hygrometricum TaxID=472368 RepID=A0A2Z7CRA7_9LAMI|nr:hypothetical protein F511_15452 [Dorcoceras hygrometricum]